MDIAGFTDYLRLRNHSPITIATYRRDLEKFESFLKQRRLRVTQVRPKIVLEFLAGGKPLAEAKGPTVMRRLAAVSSFYSYLQLTSDGRIRNPVDVIRRPKRQPPSPRAADPLVLEALVSGITNPRDKAIVSLFRSTGLRLSELARLDRNSIQVEEAALGNGLRRVLGVGHVIGKGNKERDFLVDLDSLKLLHAYLQKRGQDGLRPLFLSNRKKRMSARMIEVMLRNWCRKLNLPEVRPHAIRHAFATHLHGAGIGTLEIARLLGHSSIAVTERYIKPDLARLRAEYFAAMEGVPQLPASNANPAAARLPDGVEQP